MKTDLVIKHNDLIEARYELNLIEQKIILYAVTKIDTDKENFNIVHIKVSDLTELMESESPIRYSEFRIIANGLMDKKIYLKDKPGLDVRWASSSEYKGNGIIELEFSQKLIPYLLQLKNRFTRYQLKNILYLRNKHSIRIYELLKQYESIGKREFELQELKKILFIENQYNRIYDLKRFVIEPAVEEINDYTDINISYANIKKGRKIVGFAFDIEPKDQDQYIEYLNQYYNIKDMKAKMGLSNENFNSKQVMEIYQKAVEKVQDQFNPFEYVRLNYLHMIKKGTARNKYSYLLSALENDYAAAGSQLSLLDMFN